LTISAAGLKPLVAGVFQSAAAAGPKKSRNHRSVSQAGRDHNARLLMTLPFQFLELHCEIPVTGACATGYYYKHESTTLKFHLAVRRQRTINHIGSCEL
jgi:hypothetical protein